jgi:hypothetical protein
MSDYVLPNDIIPGNLAPIFDENGRPFPSVNGKQLCESYTHAAARNYALLKNAGFFSTGNLLTILRTSKNAETPDVASLMNFLEERGADFDLSELFNQKGLLKTLTANLTSGQVIAAARPAHAYVWQPVEVTPVGDIFSLGEKHVFLATRGPHRLDTLGINTPAGGFAIIINGIAETSQETAIRELTEELGLSMMPDDMRNLGIVTPNGSPSILPVKTKSGTVLAGVIPEFMPAYAAILDRPFHQLPVCARFSLSIMRPLAYWHLVRPISIA